MALVASVNALDTRTAFAILTTNMSAGRIQNLVTLPPRMAKQFPALSGLEAPDWFACSDPAGQPLGSGGATAHLLASAWKASLENDFSQWLAQSQKLIMHAGGLSRRVPAYAPTGKLLMPIPVFRWSQGQRLDQTLLDLQLPDYQRVLQHAGPEFGALLTSGDVLLRFARRLPPFPQVDVLGLGMPVPPEKAKDFGVFFMPRGRPEQLAFFLQKPSAARIRELAEQYLAQVDTGMWLLSQRAIEVLMNRCGWSKGNQCFTGNQPKKYEFYAEFALASGENPTAQDSEVAQLSCAVIPLPEAQFYHFGTNAQMLESVSALQNLVLDGPQGPLPGARRQPDQVNQNSKLSAVFPREGDVTFWIENSVIPQGWHLATRHVLTGVPDNNWKLQLEPDVCLDFVPVGAHDFCVRAYGFTDSFSGKLGEGSTNWFGRPALSWFKARRLEPSACGLDLKEDLQFCPLFPVVTPDQLSAPFVHWLYAATPEDRNDFASLWQTRPRLSAQQLCQEINLTRLFAQRDSLRQSCLVPMLNNFRRSVFFRLDLESTARTFALGKVQIPEILFDERDDPMHRVHGQMFRSAVLRQRGNHDWVRFEAGAFAQLRELMVKEAQLAPARPRRNVLDDQIVWARSPVRLDLAGGWTDTPPYCLQHGGKVLNVAVDINGQPPIQVFAKLSDTPHLLMRSIDLGVEERVRTYDELDTFAQPDKPFALAKAAFALAGFLPRFHTDGGFSSLEAQLRDFGAGIELSLLSAVPKGSGLGTSSILAATVLAALSDLCGLGWDRRVLFTRTLAVEQMLTTGGGWQDQAGAIFRGIKLIETGPGLAQTPTLRWLPDHLFSSDTVNRSILLYYTGVTRLAKNILAEIVRGLFLNSPAHLRNIADIGANADLAAAAIQSCDYDGLVAAIRNSWSLNQKLDSGTNPVSIQEILDRVQPHLAACKLLGAGGGGYLLMFANDAEAGARIKQILTSRPLNTRGRFVDFSVSQTGLELTRS